MLHDSKLSSIRHKCFMAVKIISESALTTLKILLLNLKLTGGRFEPHQRHLVVYKTFYPQLITCSTHNMPRHD